MLHPIICLCFGSTTLHADKFCILLSSAIQNLPYSKNSLIGIPLVSNKLEPDQPDVLLGLIWIHSVCKGYQQRTLTELNLLQGITKNLQHTLNFFPALRNQMRPDISCDMSIGIQFTGSVLLFFLIRMKHITKFVSCCNCDWQVIAKGYQFMKVHCISTF